MGDLLRKTPLLILGLTIAVAISHDLSAENPAERWYDIAVEEENKGSLRDALYAYRRAIEISPEFADAWLKKADILYGWERYQDALSAFIKVIKLSPGNAYSWARKGDVFRAMNKDAEALAAYGESLNILTTSELYKG